MKRLDSGLLVNVFKLQISRSELHPLVQLVCKGVFWVK